MQNTNNIKYLYFSYKDFTSENLTKEFKRNFLLNSCYSLIIKLITIIYTFKTSERNNTF